MRRHSIGFKIISASDIQRQIDVRKIFKDYGFDENVGDAYNRTYSSSIIKERNSRISDSSGPAPDKNAPVKLSDTNGPKDPKKSTLMDRLKNNKGKLIALTTATIYLGYTVRGSYADIPQDEWNNLSSYKKGWRIVSGMPQQVQKQYQYLKGKVIG